ncbi:MAG: mannose-1-phosphate guanylyltransferase/mannose-6-phosphate isomerase [Alphaproteobacteria bacterium]|nr:mannose-1-phosphate guanylyltransferase/mannose-6-phosphate isomerase [Alphaproteobacteria bacterium]
MKIIPVIMAGGRGSRIWSLSRENYPKQFIKIFDAKSLFQLCLTRNKQFSRPIVIVGPEHRFIAQEQAEEVGIDIEIIIEPVAKNTEACAMIASHFIKDDNEACILLLPADHYITSEELYINDIKEARNLLKDYDIITIGIKPSSPHTGYGYIKIGHPISSSSYSVEKFTEKPSLEAVNKFLSSGKFYWNSGILLFNNKMQEISNILSPQTKKYVESSLLNSEKDLGFLRLAAEDYGKIEPNSIDYAIMEKAQNIALKEASFTWSDLGSFLSVWDSHKKDKSGNLCEGYVLCLEGEGNYIYSPDKLTVVSGVSDLVIVNTQDALLVTCRNQPEKVKHIVDELKIRDRVEIRNSDLSYRPWGSYRVINSGDKFKVKKIIVHPGKKLSLQYHYKRSEHWIIISGIAEVQRGEEIRILNENDSMYIPKLMKHSLRNIGEVALHLIEVQTGHYLGEDDIVRLSDLYGRK